MSLDKSILLDFLTVLDDEVSKRITRVAVGGTAMTLLDLKSSTIDVDFTIPSKDSLCLTNRYRRYRMALKYMHGQTELFSLRSFMMTIWRKVL